MSQLTAPTTTAHPPTPAPDPRRWVALGVIALAQLMVVLDGTVVNIALPQAQKALQISDANRSWVVTAYALTFGGLLLLGGRLGDYFGRKRAFIIGAVGFAAASALGGAAVNATMLFGGRALQGAFAALLAPAALSMLNVTFTDAKERATAFSVYGAVSGGGAAVGLLLGGLLTEYLDWRWTLFVNLFVAAATVGLAIPFLRDSGHGPAKAPHLDVPGAVLATAGLASLVYGFTHATSAGWAAASTLSLIGAGLLLLVGFVAVEHRSAAPLLPLRIPGDRTRGGAYLTTALTGAGFVGSILFVTYYTQGVLHYSPVKSGLSALPLSFGVVVAAASISKVLARVGPKPLLTIGGLVAGVGMLALTRVGTDTGVWTHLLIPEFVLGIGIGCLFVPAASAAVAGIGSEDSGAASAMNSAAQQVGGSVGTALLNTLYASAVTAYASAHAHTATSAAQGLVHGYRVAFGWGGVLLIGAAVAAAVLVRRGPVETPPDGVALAG